MDGFQVATYDRIASFGLGTITVNGANDKLWYAQRDWHTRHVVFYKNFLDKNKNNFLKIKNPEIRKEKSSNPSLKIMAPAGAKVSLGRWMFTFRPSVEEREPLAFVELHRYCVSFSHSDIFFRLEQSSVHHGQSELFTLHCEALASFVSSVFSFSKDDYVNLVCVDSYSHSVGQALGIAQLGVKFIPNRQSRGMSLIEGYCFTWSQESWKSRNGV